MQLRDTTYSCRLENLSLVGALVTIKDAVMTDIHSGDICLLRLYHEIEGRYITVEAQVAHCVFAFVGLAFINLEVETQASLQTIIAREKYKTLTMCDKASYYLSSRSTERYASF